MFKRFSRFISAGICQFNICMMPYLDSTLTLKLKPIQTSYQFFWSDLIKKCHIKTLASSSYRFHNDWNQTSDFPWSWCTHTHTHTFIISRLMKWPSYQIGKSRDLFNIIKISPDKISNSNPRLMERNERAHQFCLPFGHIKLLIILIYQTLLCMCELWGLLKWQHE